MNQLNPLFVEQIKEMRQNRNRIMGRLLGRSFRFMSEIAGEFIKARGYVNFRISDVMLLVNLDLNGSNVNTLAQNIGVTKQAVSKLVKRLQEMGYVTTQADLSDKRSLNVYMTNKGAEFMVEWKGCAKEIDNKFAEIMGAKKLETLKDLLEELSSHYSEKIQ